MSNLLQVAGFDYHDVTDDPANSGFSNQAALSYKLTRQAFAAHLDAIAAGPVAPSRVTDIDFTRPARYLVLTFDDGGKSALYAGEALCRRGWRGHFFVVSSLLGKAHFLTAADLRHLASCGHVVGSHSHTHPHIFRDLTPERMLAEWRVSGDAVSQILGAPCPVAAVPGGDVSPTVLRSAAFAGFRYLFTSEPWLGPRLVGGCWVLGRFCPKADTAAARIRALAQFRGWTSALLVRRLKGLARSGMPPVYRRYVQLTTREATRAD